MSNHEKPREWTLHGVAAKGKDKVNGLYNLVGPRLKDECVEVIEKSYAEKLESELRNIDRAVLIAERRLHGDNSDKMDASQEAAHYNWLDDENEKLKAELASLKSAHAELLSYLPKVPSQPHEKEMAQEIASLRADLQTTKGHNERLQGLANAAGEGLKKAVNERDELKAEVDGYEKNLKLYEESIRHSFKEREDKLKAKLEASEGRLADAQRWERNYHEMRALKDSTVAKLEAAEKEIERLNKYVIAGYEQINSEMKAEVERLNHRAVKAETAFDGLQEIANRYRTALEKLIKSVPYNLYEPDYLLEAKQSLASESVDKPEKSGPIKDNCNHEYVPEPGCPACDSWTAENSKSRDETIELLKLRIEGMILSLKEHGQNINVQFHIDWLEKALEAVRGKA